MKPSTNFYEQIKTIEMRFMKNTGVNIVMEEEAIDDIIAQWLKHDVTVDAVYEQLSNSFQYGLKLVREKTGRNRFFITSQALENPDEFIRQQLKDGTTPALQAPASNAANDTTERNPD